MNDAPAVRLVALIRRKPGTTRDEFIQHYEDHHARLIAGRKHPWLAEYTRNYVVPGTEIGKLDGAAGTAPDCDVVTIASFATSADYDAFSAASLDQDFRAAVVADEETFMDRDSIRFFRVDTRVTDLSEFGADGSSR